MVVLLCIYFSHYIWLSFLIWFIFVLTVGMGKEREVKTTEYEKVSEVPTFSFITK